MHPATRPTGWHIAGFVRQFLGAAALVLFVNPFALLVAAIGGWLLALTVGSVVRLAATGAEWNVPGCAAYVLALALVTALAIGHVVITAVGGWGGARSAA